MNITNNKNILIFLAIISFLSPDWAQAHIKWFVEFDISDPPFTLFNQKHQIYYTFFIFLSLLGVALALLIDQLWQNKLGKFTFIKQYFTTYDDISLNIARIGTGVFFVSIWLMSDVIFSPELLSNHNYIAYIQMLIVFSVLSKRTIALAGIGIISLYVIAVYDYGLFHLLDYITFIGLAIYLILSSLTSDRFKEIKAYRLTILYSGLIFSFLWSSIEKLAYPEWFYDFLGKYSVLTVGLDIDFFIIAAAFIEFTLFFLLLVTRNGLILLAFLINLLLIAGNIYFGKTDTIGHFPANFILIIFLINGALGTHYHFFKTTATKMRLVVKGMALYLLILGLFISSYYAIHGLLYEFMP